VKKVVAAGFKPPNKALSEPATCPWRYCSGVYFFIAHAGIIREIYRECDWRTKTDELDKNQVKV